MGNETICSNDKEFQKKPVGGIALIPRRLVLSRLAKLPRGRLRILEPDGNMVQLGEGRRPTARIEMHRWSTYDMMMSGGALGAGEAYMEGAWSSPDLVEVIRYFALNINALSRLEGGLAFLAKPVMKGLHFLNRNSLRGSRRNIAAHYDLGNDFFSLFLDRTMMYSSALFPHPEATLEEASEHKMAVIAEKLALQPGMRILEIGTGWGGLALYLARHYEIQIVTTTLSREQAHFARRQVREAGLEDRITVLERDYRELQGRFDRIVSIEMIEAVGAEYLDGYARILGERLKPDGLMVLQAITVPDQRYRYALRQMDFIKRYIFPGGFLPSVSVICSSLAEQTPLVVTGIDDIGQDYALTLRHWRDRFYEKLASVRDIGFDERFVRMWEYYLCYCEGAFLERAISTIQLVAAGPDYRPARAEPDHV